MVKMYSTRRPAERTCVAQRATFMLIVLVLAVLLSMRRFLASNSSLNLEQGTISISKNAGVVSGVSSIDVIATESSNNIAESSNYIEEEVQEDGYSILKSKFPSFDNRGVVVFYHASRTGGLTIRQNFANRQQDGIKYVKLGHSTQALNIADKIVRHILNRNSTRTSTMIMENNADGGIEAGAEAARPETFVMEIPGELTTLMQLSKLLEEWRILAAEHGTSFFAFTLIRDPVPFHVSFFNTYIAPPLEPTVENLLQSMPRNEQCRRLVQNNNIIVVEEQESLTQCQEAYDWMRNGLDWIGTTENLNQDTLPILSHLLLQNANIGQSMPSFVPQTADNPNKLLVEHLSQEDATRIRELSEMDQKMYQDVLQDFAIDKESNK